MKINALITRKFVTVSVLEDTRDVSEWLHRDDYVVVIDEHEKALGVLTLKDIYTQPNARNVLDCEFVKPIVSPQQTILEAFSIMKQVESNYLPVFDSEGFCGVISLSAITERLMNIVEQSRQEYQRVIHDLRNPVANLQALLKLLNDTVSDQETADLLKLCTFSNKHASEILDDLLFVEVEESKPLAKETTEINQFFQQCITEQLGLSSLKNIKVETEICNDHITKNVDRIQFKRAVQNVISNAIKFSYPNSTIKISSKVDGDKVILKILDAGIGIPEKDYSEVFKRFTPAGRPGTSGEPSTGLGLCFSKRCIEQHGGSIYFKSVEGKGTKFYISL